MLKSKQNKQNRTKKSKQNKTQPVPQTETPALLYNVSGITAIACALVEFYYFALRGKMIK